MIKLLYEQDKAAIRPEQNMAQTPESRAPPPRPPYTPFPPPCLSSCRMTCCAERERFVSTAGSKAQMFRRLSQCDLVSFRAISEFEFKFRKIKIHYSFRLA
jgi:hypothetical protein